MSATNLFEDNLLDLLFTNIGLPNLGNAAGVLPSSVAGSLYISLHTGTLVDTNALQTDSETSYTSYARQAVPRSLAGWTVAAGTVDNDSAITFPQITGGAGVITDSGIGFALNGAGELQMYGVMSSPLTIANAVTPEFAPGSLDISLD